MSQRFKAEAVIKVHSQQRTELLRLIDQLLVEYIGRGGPLTGSEYGKQLMTTAFDGGDLAKVARALVKWLNDDDKKKGRGQE